MKNLQKQNGLTMWGWLVILAMVGYIGIQAFAMFTPMIHYNTFKSVLNGMAEDPKNKGASIKTIQASLQKKLDFNGVRGFKAKNKEQFIAEKKRSGTIEVKVLYEQRASLFGPVEMLLVLDETVEIPGK